MRTQIIRTPQQKMDSSIASAKEQCKKSIEWAKLRYKVETETPDKVAKFIDGLIKKNDDRASKLFDVLERTKRKQVAIALVGNDRSVKARVFSYCGLDIMQLKLSAERFKIEFTVRPKMTIRHDVDYVSMPTRDQIIRVALQYFPKVNDVILPLPPKK